LLSSVLAITLSGALGCGDEDEPSAAPPFEPNDTGGANTAGNGGYVSAGGAAGYGGHGAASSQGGSGGVLANPPPPGELLSPPYLMWATPDGVSVRWESFTSSIGTVHFGQELSLTDSVSEVEPVRTHEIRLSGLSPGARHSYQIAWNGWSLPPVSFQTALDTNDDSPFNFIVWGDNQNGPDTFGELVTVMASQAPHFAISAGDVVQEGTRALFRQQLFAPLSPLANHVPFLVAAGNHERYSDSDAILFDEYLSQPADEHCFGWRWGKLYVMFIDTELSIEAPSPQYQCIVDALSSSEATSATFRAAIFHKPPRIEWWVGGSAWFTTQMEAPWIREQLEPLLESLSVDIVFNGHNHLYAYTPETTGGITWVTTGGGGGALDTNDSWWEVGDWPEIEVTYHEHHFLSVLVQGPQMTVSAIDLAGETLHEFTISK
jgi:acid phosphatase type 7